MIGQHVGSDQAHARGTLGALRNAGGMTAREQTHANGESLYKDSQVARPLTDSR